MEITTNKIDGANATVAGTISQEEINKNVDKIAKTLTKTANVQGFRKGKVPVSVIKKQYGEKLTQDAEGEVIRDLLDQGLKALEIASEALIGEPQVTKFDKTDDKIDVEITIAMRPEIDLGDYKALVPDFEEPEVTDEMIENRIKELADSQATLIDVEEDRAAESGDTVVIDFEGSIDGELFEGGAAQDFALALGSGQFIPGFEDQVIGMKKGEEKVIKVTFPENYGSDKLAGKEAEFKVNLKKIQTKEAVEINDELAKKLIPNEENATVDMLKEQIKQQLVSEALGKLYNDELKPKLLETFVEKFSFDLPKFVVEQEMDIALNKKAQEMSEAELNEIKENADKVKELRETFRDEASRSVKATFIIDALAQEEGVKVEEQEVMQTIYFEAMQMGQDPQQAYENYKNQGYIPAIQMAMVEDKVLSQLLNTKIKAA